MPSTDKQWVSQRRAAPKHPQRKAVVTAKQDEHSVTELPRKHILITNGYDSLAILTLIASFAGATSPLETGVVMSLGARVTQYIDGFIPEDILNDREARTRARMFMCSHTFGPILGGVIPVYLLFIDPTAKWKLMLLAGSIFSFWAYPFMLKSTGKYQALSYASIQNLLFAILWGCYFYGGLSSPFLPWLVTVPLLAFFYLKANAVTGAIIALQIMRNLLAFSVAIEVYGLPHTIPVENMAVIGVISTASAAIYVSMMALYYAGILASQKEFEDEARLHMETSHELRERRRKGRTRRRGQGRVSGADQPRAAHAAQRRHRLQRGAARGDRSGQRPAGRRGSQQDPRRRQASAGARQRHSRPFEDRGRDGCSCFPSATRWGSSCRPSSAAPERAPAASRSSPTSSPMRASSRSTRRKSSRR